MAVLCCLASCLAGLLDASRSTRVSVHGQEVVNGKETIQPLAAGELSGFVADHWFMDLPVAVLIEAADVEEFSEKLVAPSTTSSPGDFFPPPETSGLPVCAISHGSLVSSSSACLRNLRSTLLLI